MAEQLALMNQGVIDNPERYYQEVLGRAPFQDTDSGLWVVSRYQDVAAILPDTRNYSNQLTLFPHYELCPEAMQELGKLMDVPQTTAGSDDPIHAKARRTISATFTTSVPRTQRQLGGIVDTEVDAQLERVAAAAGRQDGTVDLIHQFAWELPLRINMRVLGFPPERFEDIKRWSMGQIALTWSKLPPAEQVTAAQGLVHLWQESLGLIESRLAMQEGGEVLPDDMAAKLVADGRLSREEMASVILNFAVAGHETTANAIGNSVFDILSRRPELWREMGVARGSNLISGVVEEELRLNPPIIGWSRLTKAPVTVNGVEIPPGQRVLLLLGAANRDGGHFAQPDEFRLGRPGDHVSFGLGAHFCVGAPLARLEMTKALGKLTALYPDAQLAPGFAEQPAKYHPNLGFRALRALPVVLSQAAEPRPAGLPG